MNRQQEAGHACTPETCPVGTYYVTAVDGGNYWLMAGPYDTHQAALADVDKALEVSNEADPRSWWKAWGTAKIKDDTRKPGVLNERGLFPAVERAQ